MIKGKRYLKIIEKEKFKPFVYSLENIKLLFDTFNKIVIAEYFYDNGIDRQCTWIDEWREQSLGVTSEWVWKTTLEEMTSKQIMKRKNEKRFFYSYKRNTLQLFFYLRDISFERKDLYFIFYNEEPYMPPIYIVTAFERLSKKNFMCGARQIMGYFYDKNDAEYFIKVNKLDLSAEGMFEYVALEERLQGVPSCRKSIDWYQYINNKFVKVKKSNKLYDVVFTSMG